MAVSTGELVFSILVTKSMDVALVLSFLVARVWWMHELQVFVVGSYLIEEILIGVVKLRVWRDYYVLPQSDVV